MKTIQKGFLLLLTLFVLFIYTISCATFHQVEFQSEACIIPYQDFNYKTCKAIKVKVDDQKFTIPKGFKTDLASIPRPLWPVFAPQYSGFVAPAILHDYLYRCSTPVTRKFADEVLYSALITENISPFTAYKFYLGVRWFGANHFISEVCE